MQYLGHYDVENVSEWHLMQVEFKFTIDKQATCQWIKLITLFLIDKGNETDIISMKK